MKDKKIIFLVIFLAAVVAAIVVYDYTFNSEHRDIAKEEATVVLNANELYSQFETDEATATVSYLDQVIETKGKITAIDNNDIELDGSVQVTLSSAPSQDLKEGSNLTVKGRCVGYDELLEMVKIDQATIIKN